MVMTKPSIGIAARTSSRAKIWSFGASDFDMELESISFC
jgi:hypothetical protein